MYQPLLGKDTQLQNIDFKQAQPWCNFVLMVPGKLPSDMYVMEQQLRTESSGGHRSTYRMIIGNDKRKASMKQFLYDWAPPAYDHPNLWRDPEIASIKETPAPTPFLLGNNVAWMGLNYRRQAAASINILRTSIEITIIEGAFTYDEISDIINSLYPVDETLKANILSTSFAELSYAYRHPSNASPVPLSYWQYNRQETMPILGYAWADAPAHILKQYREPPEAFGYRPNSVFTVGPTENPSEIEFYYEHKDYPGVYVRILITPASSKFPIPFPPQLDSQSCNSFVDHKTLAIYHAFLTEELGPHEAVWQQDGKVFLLLTKPAPWTNRAWMSKLMDAIR